MFGWKRRKERKAAEKAAKLAAEERARAAADLEADDAEEPWSIEPPASEIAPEPPDNGPEAPKEPRPLIDLLADGERLGFEPELHAPD